MKIKCLIILIMFVLIGCDVRINTSDSGEYICPACSSDKVTLYSHFMKFKVMFVCISCQTKSGWFDTITLGTLIWKRTENECSSEIERERNTD